MEDFSYPFLLIDRDVQKKMSPILLLHHYPSYYDLLNQRKKFKKKGFYVKNITNITKVSQKSIIIF